MNAADKTSQARPGGNPVQEIFLVAAILILLGAMAAPQLISAHQQAQAASFTQNSLRSIPILGAEDSDGFYDLAEDGRVAAMDSYIFTRGERRNGPGALPREGAWVGNFGQSRVPGWLSTSGFAWELDPVSPGNTQRAATRCEVPPMLARSVRYGYENGN